MMRAREIVAVVDAHDEPRSEAPTGKASAVLGLVAAALLGAAAVFAISSMSNPSEDESPTPEPVTEMASRDQPVVIKTEDPAEPAKEDGAAKGDSAAVQVESVAESDALDTKAEESAPEDETSDEVAVAAAPAGAGGVDTEDASLVSLRSHKSKRAAAPRPPRTREEPFEVYKREPVDEKLAAALNRFKFISGGVEQQFHSYEVYMTKVSLDEAGRVADHYLDAARYYDLAARDLRKAASMEPKDAAFDAAAKKLATTLSGLGKVQHEMTQYMFDQGWKEAPEKVKDFDGRYRKLFAQYVPLRDEYVGAVYQMEKRVLEARLATTNRRTTPAMYHFHAAQLDVIKGMIAAERSQGSNALRHTKSAVAHIEAWEKIDLKKAFPVLEGKHFNGMKDVMRGTKPMNKKFVELDKKQRSISALRSGLEAQRDLANAWYTTYMAYHIAVRRYHGRNI